VEQRSGGGESGVHGALAWTWCTANQAGERARVGNGAGEWHGPLCSEFRRGYGVASTAPCPRVFAALVSLSSSL
jgi:hypothetical protein